MSCSSRWRTTERRQALRGLALLLLAPAGARGLAAAPPTPAEPPPPELADAPGGPFRLQGHGTLRFLGLAVYDARLWVGPSGLDPARWAERPLALELAYARSLVGARIAERSLDEMRRQAEPTPPQAQAWLAAMSRLFPDVRASDRLTGQLLPGEGAAFFHNGGPRGELRDATFARLFFGIWLSPQTSEPALRERLLGGAR